MTGSKKKRKRKRKTVANFSEKKIMRISPHILGLKPLLFTQQSWALSLTLPELTAYGDYCLFYMSKNLVSGYFALTLLCGPLYERKIMCKLEPQKGRSSTSQNHILQ